MTSRRRLTISSIAIACTVLSPKAEACTTFLAPTVQGPVIAKNFDWMTGDGWFVANERGRLRTMLFAEHPVASSQWTARFASLTLTTIGPGFPISGMNDAGLVVEALVDFSVQPRSLPQPNTLTSLELIQYGLDQCASAQDFADTASRMNFTQLGVGLHFFACDRSGICVVVETRGERVNVTSGTQLGVRVMANRRFEDDYHAPSPSWFARLFGFGAASPRSSEQRFRTVSSRLSSQGTRNVNEAFQLLDDVKMDDLTKWQLVWQPAQNQLQFRLPGRFEQVQTARVDLNLACEGSSKVLRLGSVNGPFVSWSPSDTQLTHDAVLRQLGSWNPAANGLAARIASSTNSSECPNLR